MIDLVKVGCDFLGRAGYRGGSNRKYDVKDDFFKCVDNEEKAYWLGFLAADGCVNDNGMVTLTLSSVDKNHLEKFAKTISTGIYKIRDRTYKNYQRSCFYFTSHKMKDDLSNYGVVPRKTYKMILPTISSKLMRHWIRGFFDGDGGFSVFETKYGPDCSFMITGDIKLLKKIQLILMKECDLKETKISLKGESKQFGTLEYSGNNQVNRICMYLYNDATVFLNRKKEKIQLGLSRTGRNVEW